MLRFSCSASPRGPSALLLHIGGELDGCTRPEFVSRVAAALWSAPINAIDLDLADVDFIDCSGLGALVEVRNLAADRQCSLALTRCSRSVTRLLTMTGMGGYFGADPIDQTAVRLPRLRLARSELID